MDKFALHLHFCKAKMLSASGGSPIAEQRMGRWVMGQMGHENGMGHMGHGSLGDDP